MKRILVTGSNGLLGQKLVYKLKLMNDVVCIAVGKGPNRLIDQEGYEYFDADITDHSTIQGIVKKSKPDFIIHTAAMTNVDACESDRENCKKINIDAVENIANISDELKIHLIHISTDFIFDGVAGPYDETAEANPISYYGWSKLEAEKLVKKMSSSWAILRTVLVYGIVDSRSRTNVVTWVKESLEKNLPINVVNDQWRTPTFAEDLAEGCILVTMKAATGIYNISGKDFMNIFEIACKVADHYSLDKSLIHQTDSSSLNQPAKRPPITGFIIDKAKTNLGYNPHSFEESLIILDKQLK